jgi:hypothetical protein
VKGKRYDVKRFRQLMDRYHSVGSFIISPAASLAAAERAKRRGAKLSPSPSLNALRLRKKRILDKYPAGAEPSEEDRRRLNEIEGWKRNPRIMKALRKQPPKFAIDAMVAIGQREQKIKKLQQEIDNIRKLLDRCMHVEFDEKT